MILYGTSIFEHLTQLLVGCLFGGGAMGGGGGVHPASPATAIIIGIIRDDEFYETGLSAEVPLSIFLNIQISLKQ